MNRIAAPRRFTRSAIASAILAGLMPALLWGGPPSAVPRAVGTSRAKAALASAPRLNGRTVLRGESGAQATGLEKTPSAEQARGALARVEALANDPAAAASPQALGDAITLLPAVRADVDLLEKGALDPARVPEFEAEVASLENLEGRILKGDPSVSVLRGPGYSEAPRIFAPAVPTPEGSVTKVNTGWILDRHVYDETITKQFPTLPRDMAGYDEGAGAIAIGKDGWVWEVHSLYWTDTTTVANHPAPSYCLMVMVSPDGGGSWALYELLYDSSSKDLINPSLALDTVATADRFFIAYERAYSAIDHDIYVYSETSGFFAGSTPNPQTASIATSTLMEENASVASDFTTGQTSYRVVTYDKEFISGGSDYDIWAGQSTGAGAQADWIAAVAVANTAGMESHAALASGTSGGGTFTGYMHLAYNYDTFTPSQLLLNPGFELSDNGNWAVRVTGDISCNATNVRTGTCKGWLGGTLSQPNDWIYQPVTIPADATTAGLVYYLKIVSTDSTTVPYDYLYAEIRDSTGTLLKSLASYSNADQTAYASYVVAQFNLMEFRGQTIRIHFWASNDATNTTSFYLDDTAVNVTTPATATAHEVRYAKAQHPGATAYPAGLVAATKVTVLTNTGATWAYGAPSITATHGGSTTMTPGRVVVAADQAFPAGSPTAGDPARTQVCFAWNTCNGSTTCTSITCTPANISLNWLEAYFYDNKSDEGSPSLVEDGAGLGTNGVAAHPLLYMAYYHKDKAAVTPGGLVQVIATNTSDETCTGFAAGSWGYFTFQAKATDDDDSVVVTRPRTIAAFNYWDGWPGVAFNKLLNHLGGTANEDVYFTTLGDNYTFDTIASGAHIDAGFSLGAVHYAAPSTFPWPAGYTWTMTADNPVETGFRYYDFSSWSSGETTPAANIVSDFCGAVGACPNLNYSIFYSGGCLVSQPEVAGLTAAKQAGNINLTWTPSGQPGDVGVYTVYRATSPTAAANYAAAGTSATAAYLDSAAMGPVYYYIVVGGCGPYTGPWGAYGQ